MLLTSWLPYKTASWQFQRERMCRLLRLYSSMRLLAVSWSCISRPKLDQWHNATASSLCCVCSRFFRANETESRLPFSENLKLKVGRFREIDIGSEQWTCILCIRLLARYARPPPSWGIWQTYPIVKINHCRIECKMFALSIWWPKCVTACYICYPH